MGNLYINIRDFCIVIMVAIIMFGGIYIVAKYYNY